MRHGADIQNQYSLSAPLFQENYWFSHIIHQSIAANNYSTSYASLPHRLKCLHFVNPVFSWKQTLSFVRNSASSFGYAIQAYIFFLIPSCPNLSSNAVYRFFPISRPFYSSLIAKTYSSQSSSARSISILHNRNVGFSFKKVMCIQQEIHHHPI